MASALAVLLVLAVLTMFWSAHRAASEAAVRIGRNACRAAGVQWLDESVQFSGMRLCRHDNGRLGMERRFHFDYSRSGDDRHRGRIVMLGRELREFVGPREHSEPPLLFDGSR